jgi:uncharacterized protein (TIGR02147 family)
MEQAFRVSSGRTSGKTLHLGRDRFKCLHEWQHLAILDLTFLEDFEPSFSWVADRLGITQRDARSAARRLERLGLLEITESRDGMRWKKKTDRLRVMGGVADSHVRKFHRQMINKARESLQDDLDTRDISGTTIPVNPVRLPEARKRIARFRRALMDYLSEGPRTELYQLNVQLFRLTREKRWTA